MQKAIKGILLILLLSACSVIPIDLPGAEATSTPVEATPTAVPSSTPLPPTITPTETPLPTLTPTSVSTETPVPSPTTSQGDKPYQVQPSSPVYLQNFTHQTLGCNWLGVAGQVFDASGAPVLNLVVVVEGFLNDKPVEALGLTGLAGSYGPGGYEIQLANSAVASSQSLFITLFDLNGTPLSDPVVFDTVADCNKNLVIVNFQRK